LQAQDRNFDIPAIIECLDKNAAGAYFIHEIWHGNKSNAEEFCLTPKPLEKFR